MYITSGSGSSLSLTLLGHIVLVGRREVAAAALCRAQRAALCRQSRGAAPRNLRALHIYRLYRIVFVVLLSVHIRVCPRECADRKFAAPKEGIEKKKAPSEDYCVEAQWKITEKPVRMPAASR